MNKNINKLVIACLIGFCSNVFAQEKNFRFYHIGESLERTKNIKLDGDKIVIFKDISPLCVNCYSINGILLDSCDCPYEFIRDEFDIRSENGLGYISKSPCVFKESPNRYVFKCHINLIDSSYVKDATIRVISFFRSFSDSDAIIFTIVERSKVKQVKFQIKGMQVQNLVQFDRLRFIVHYSDSRFNIYRFGVIELYE